MAQINFYSSVEVGSVTRSGMYDPRVPQENARRAVSDNQRLAKIMRVISSYVALPQAEYNFLMRAFAFDDFMWSESWDHSVPVNHREFDHIGRRGEVVLSRDHSRMWVNPEALFRPSGPFAGKI